MRQVRACSPPESICSRKPLDTALSARLLHCSSLDVGVLYCFFVIDYQQRAKYRLHARPLLPLSEQLATGSKTARQNRESFRQQIKEHEATHDPQLLQGLHNGRGLQH